MIESGLKGVEFIAVNTDAQALLMSDADVKLDIGRDLTRVSARVPTPRWVGRQPRITCRRSRRCSGRRHGLVTAGEGRRHRHRWGARRGEDRPWSGSSDHRRRHSAVHLRGSSPRDPGRRRNRWIALRGRHLIVIPNDRLLTLSDRKISVIDAFKQADQVLYQGVSGITDLSHHPGLINLDFADVKSVMKDAGSALMGIGPSRGGDCAPPQPPRRSSRVRCWRPASRAPRGAPVHLRW